MHVQEWVVVYVWIKIRLVEANLITPSYTDMTAMNYTLVDKVYETVYSSSDSFLEYIAVLC